MVLGLRRDKSFKRLLFVRSRLGFNHGACAFEKHVSEVRACRARSWPASEGASACVGVPACALCVLRVHNVHTYVLCAQCVHVCGRVCTCVLCLHCVCVHAYMCHVCTVHVHMDVCCVCAVRACARGCVLHVHIPYACVHMCVPARCPVGIGGPPGLCRVTGEVELVPTLHLVVLPQRGGAGAEAVARPRGGPGYRLAVPVFWGSVLPVQPRTGFSATSRRELMGGSPVPTQAVEGSGSPV